MVKVDDDVSLDKAVLVGCGVPTGWGSAVNAAAVSPGETVIVTGVGGIGIVRRRRRRRHLVRVDDRSCRLTVGHQTAEDEGRIVALRTPVLRAGGRWGGLRGASDAPALLARLLSDQRASG